MIVYLEHLPFESIGLWSPSSITSRSLPNAPPVITIATSWRQHITSCSKHRKSSTIYYSHLFFPSYSIAITIKEDLPVHSFYSYNSSVRIANLIYRYSLYRRTSGCCPWLTSSAHNHNNALRPDLLSHTSLQSTSSSPSTRRLIHRIKRYSIFESTSTTWYIEREHPKHRKQPLDSIPQLTRPHEAFGTIDFTTNTALYIQHLTLRDG